MTNSNRAPEFPNACIGILSAIAKILEINSVAGSRHSIVVEDHRPAARIHQARCARSRATGNGQVVILAKDRALPVGGV